jgi:exonuclease 3'-5' domain-containing protein 2
MSYSYRRSNPDISLGYFRYSFGNDIALPILRHGPLGFDLEWRPNFRKSGKKNPVALVQIANAHFVFLVQISAMARTFSLHLRSYS